MGIGQRIHRLTKFVAVVAPLGFMLTPTIAVADTKWIATTFSTQYQQNTSTEAQLLQTAQALSFSNSKTLKLSSRLQALNNEIAQLYTQEQLLAAQVGNGSPSHSDDSDVKQAKTERSHLLTQWLSAVHAIANHHGHGKSLVVSEVNQTADRMTNIVSQLAQLDDTIGRGRGHSNHGAYHGHPLNGQLQSVQRRILSLQRQAIEELREWIRIASQGNPGIPASTIAGAMVTASTGLTVEGATVTYTAQLIDGNGKSVAEAGIRVDFSLVGANQDGSIVTASAVTNASGQATVSVTAGNSVGTMQVGAQVYGTNLPVATGPVVQVTAPSLVGTHLVAQGTSFPTSVSVGQSTSAATVIYPETAAGSVVAGDTLQVNISNTAVLAFANGSTGGVMTLAAGQYTLPAITGKAVGAATVTITDMTSVQHPSISYTVNVTALGPVALAVVNPNGTVNTSYAVNSGVAGPFQIALVNAAGADVPSPTNIVLTAAQVNHIIGAGTAVRAALAANDVSTVLIPTGQTSVTVYTDNTTAGQTAPQELQLNSFAPSLLGATVKDAHTVSMTFNQGLVSTAPNPDDFWIDIAGRWVHPQSVGISANTVSLNLISSDTIYAGNAVLLIYNPLSSDANPLTGVLGTKVSVLSNIPVNNPL